MVERNHTSVYFVFQCTLDVVEEVGDGGMTPGRIVYLISIYLVIDSSRNTILLHHVHKIGVDPHPRLLFPD